MTKTIINNLGQEKKRNIERANTRGLLSEKADATYTNSSFVIYKDSDDIYYIADNCNDTPHEIGTAQDLNEYLESEAFQNE